MPGYIGYIRVSTPKQGSQGVSLQEQRDAIANYATRNDHGIQIWLEEIETAARQGRPVFAQALKLLREGKARGIILHKLDRGARNLRDWNALCELADQGVEIHFVSGGLDLSSRGGRLSADIQAVVSADYIRNLKEETRKGFYGRLKQGFYPLRAPIGYLDQGKAKSKVIDPVMGPWVRQAFELYGSGRHSLETLGRELFRLGLRNHHGGRVTRNGVSTLLNNPFYMGLIRIQKTNETFPGNHDPLIGKALFDRVQGVLHAKTGARLVRHGFRFRQLLTCARCGYSLIGERQKGHVYYRCHTRICSGTCIREETVVAEIDAFLRALSFNDAEKKYLHSRITSIRSDWVQQRELQTQALKLRGAQVEDRLNRLTDAYLDGALDRTAFEQRKSALLHEQKALEERRAQQKSSTTADRLEKFLELASNAWLSHEMANDDEKRQILKMLTSNRRVNRKKLELEPSIPFQTILNRSKITDCSQQRDEPRTIDPVLEELLRLDASGKLLDVSDLHGRV